MIASICGRSRTRAEHPFAARKRRLDLVIRTIGEAGATNLAYHLSCPTTTTAPAIACLPPQKARSSRRPGGLQRMH